MKKRIYQIAASLFAVAMLSVNASASYSSCNVVNSDQFNKLLALFQSTCWNLTIPFDRDCDITLPEAPTVPTLPPVTDPEEPPVTDPVEPPVTEPEVPSVPNPVEPPVTEPETPSVSESSISAYEAEVIKLVNEIRQSHGLGALKSNAKLCDVARIKSQDMRDNNYFSHTSPTYGSPFDMMKTFGISYRAAGENIAYGYRTPASVVEGWMNSDGHRANILSASFTEIGVGYVSSGNYWTQMFIG